MTDKLLEDFLGSSYTPSVTAGAQEGKSKWEGRQIRKRLERQLCIQLGRDESGGGEKREGHFHM